MSNESKLINLVVDIEDTQNKVLRSVSTIETGGGALVITTTKQLDPISNTYKITNESSSFVPESYVKFDNETEKYMIKKN